jgi:hypothetical protein
MRATMSVLIIGFLLTSLVVNHSVSDMLQSTSSDQLLSSQKPGKGNPSSPKNPPYRGSGRRERRDLLKHFNTTHLPV